MTQLISNVLMQPNPNAVERPLTLIEKLRNKRNEWASNPHYWMDSNLIGDVFSDVIRTVEAHSDWVRCDERLPNIGQRVLTQKGGYVQICSLYRRGQGKLRWDNGNRLSDLEQYTHWMPLPQPPSEVQE